MWVKICGNTSLVDAAWAAECGADAVGFVFASSPRQVTRQQVARITAALPEIEKYGVFVDAGFDEIVAAVEECGLNGVQLHSGGAGDLALRLRERFADLGILRTLHCSERMDEELAALGLNRAAQNPTTQNPAFDAVLIDSRSATAVGGTGQAYDWQSASRSFQSAAPHLRLIAAGGLTPENVAEAIATLRPWGVDVATGVEASKGKKDAQRVKSFIERARAAGAGTGAAASQNRVNLKFGA